MEEIQDKSVQLFNCGSLYLGKDWAKYEELYSKIYLDTCDRVLKDDGYVASFVTDAYVDNTIFLRSQKLRELLSKKYKLIDIKIWERCKKNRFQLPFSYFLIFVRKENKKGRFEIKNGDYHFGVWTYKQQHGGELNSINKEMSKMLVDSFTKEGDTILDPLAGESNILIVGSKMNRICYGYEINKDLISLIDKNYKEKV